MVQNFNSFLSVFLEEMPEKCLFSQAAGLDFSDVTPLFKSSVIDRIEKLARDKCV